MKSCATLTGTILLGMLLATACGPAVVMPEIAPLERTDWITAPEFRDSSEAGSWLVFRKIITLDRVPETAVSQVAADSKYWLWVNGELVVREGGLKWGPVPGGYYYDEVDLAHALRRGADTIDVLVWYFGKQGFSHRSSGRAGLLLRSPELGLATDGSWQAAVHPALSGKTSPPTRIGGWPNRTCCLTRGGRTCCGMATGRCWDLAGNGKRRTPSGATRRARRGRWRSGRISA